MSGIDSQGFLNIEYCIGAKVGHNKSLGWDQSATEDWGG